MRNVSDECPLSNKTTLPKRHHLSNWHSPYILAIILLFFVVNNLNYIFQMVVILRILGLIALFGLAGLAIFRLNGFAAEIVHPRSNPDVILDLQLTGYSCDRAVELFASFTREQRNGLKRIYTDLYDVYWPLAILAINVYIVQWATGSIFTVWNTLSFALFALDMVENIMVFLSCFISKKERMKGEEKGERGRSVEKETY